jgi:hypothetical protein
MPGGSLIVAGQNIQARMIHAGKTAIVICENDDFWGWIA